MTILYSGSSHKVKKVGEEKVVGMLLFELGTISSTK